MQNGRTVSNLDLNIIKEEHTGVVLSSLDEFQQGLVINSWFQSLRHLTASGLTNVSAQMR